MKIVWRNPNSIDRASFLIVKTLAVEQPDHLRVFYRSSRGPGALGTIFALLVNRDAVSLVRHNPSVNHSVSFECQPAALRDSKIGETLHSTAPRILNAFASQCGQIFHGPLRVGKGSRKESQSKCKAKAQFAKTSVSPPWKSPRRAPRFRRDFFNLPPRGSRCRRPGRNHPPNSPATDRNR